MWNLESAETELWKKPPDAVLESVRKLAEDSGGHWEGSPSELALALGSDMAVNRLTRHLNVNAGRLLDEYNVKYESLTRHEGRRIRLTGAVVVAGDKNKRPHGSAAERTARPLGRAVLSFTGFGMKSQQGVFREWLATRPACYNHVTAFQRLVPKLQ